GRTRHSARGEPVCVQKPRLPGPTTTEFPPNNKEYAYSGIIDAPTSEIVKTFLPSSPPSQMKWPSPPIGGASVLASRLSLSNGGSRGRSPHRGTGMMLQPAGETLCLASRIRAQDPLLSFAASDDHGAAGIAEHIHCGAA